MKDLLREQSDQIRKLHTPRADFVQDLGERIAKRAPASPTVEHFPAQFKQVFHRAVGSIMPAHIMPIAQRFATLLLVLGVTVGGWIGAVSATYNTLPGDTLYNVKLATEKVQIAATDVTGNNSKKAELHSDFAQRRAEEVKRVIETNKKPEQAKVAIALLAESVKDATDASNAARETNKEPKESEQTSKEMLDDTERITNTLRSVLSLLPANVTELIDDIALVQGTLTQSKLTTLQALVREQLAGKSSLSREETEAIVTKALQEINTDSTLTATRAKELQSQQDEKNAASIGTAVNTPTSSTLAKTATNTSSSVSAISTTSTVSEIFTESLPNMDGITEQVAAEIAVVETLVEQGELIQALEKAKTISTQQLEIEQLVKKAVAESPEPVDPIDPQITSTTPKPTVSTTETLTPSSTSTTSEQVKTIIDE